MCTRQWYPSLSLYKPTYLQSHVRAVCMYVLVQMHRHRVSSETEAEAEAAAETETDQ